MKQCCRARNWTLRGTNYFYTSYLFLKKLVHKKKKPTFGYHSACRSLGLLPSYQLLWIQASLKSGFSFIMPVQYHFNIMLLLLYFSHQEMKMILMKSSAGFSCKIGLVYFPILVSKQNLCQLEIIQLVEK